MWDLMVLIPDQCFSIYFVKTLNQNRKLSGKLYSRTL